MLHHFYLALCRDGSLYAGTCVDVKARERKHNDGKGAKYTRSKKPVRIVYHEEFSTLGEARHREVEVKKLRRKEKEALIRGGWNLRSSAEYCAQNDTRIRHQQSVRTSGSRGSRS